MSDKAVLEARYKTLLAKAAKATEPTEGEQAKTEARELAVEIEQFVVPVEPRFIVDDETGASLGKTLIEQGGRLFQAGAEGTAFANALGRFSDDEDFDVYLKSHDGDSLRIGRVGRGYSAHDNPCLTCGLAVQPAVIHSLGKSELAAGLGFLARWLYAFPEGRVGTRKTRPTPCRSITSQNYASIVSSIWLLPSDNEPMELWFSPEADDILAAFEDRLEPRLRAADGDLGNLEAWGTKLAGEVARIAGNIHMGTATGLGKLNDPGRVSATAVASAIRLAEEYLIPHAIRAFGAMHADPRESLAVRVIDWLARRPDAELFTRNEAYQGLKGGRSNLKAEDLSPAFELLTSHGYLRVEAPPKSFGRQPERYGVNPHWNRSDFRDRSPESPESRNGEAEGKLSGDSGDHFRKDAHFETEAIV